MYFPVHVSKLSGANSGFLTRCSSMHHQHTYQDHAFQAVLEIIDVQYESKGPKHKSCGVPNILSIKVAELPFERSVNLMKQKNS